MIMKQSEIDRILVKAKLCNRVKEVEIHKDVRYNSIEFHNENNIIYIIDMNDNEQIMYIPDGIKAVKLKDAKYNFHSSYTLNNKAKKITLLGCRDLISASYLFDGTGCINPLIDEIKYNVDTIDLSQADFSKVQMINCMFQNVNAKHIIMPVLTDKVCISDRIFRESHISDITGVLYYMFQSKYSNSMFYKSRIEELDLSNISLGESQLKRIYEAKIDKLVLKRDILYIGHYKYYSIEQIEQIFTNIGTEVKEIILV